MTDLYSPEAERGLEWQVWMTTRVQSYLEATMSNFYDALDLAAMIQQQAEDCAEEHTDVVITLCQVNGE